MSDALVKLLGLEQRLAAAGRREAAPTTSREELGATRRLRSEAQENGARLENGGRFEVPASLALSAMRAAGYACSRCSTRERDLQAKWKLGRRGPQDVLVLCRECARG